MEEIAVRCLVDGRVQGVGFRYWTQRKAHELGVVGWVRNLPGGAVEAVVQGPDAAVKAMLEWLETGPRHARVTSVRMGAADLDPKLVAFSVRH